MYNNGLPTTPSSSSRPSRNHNSSVKSERSAEGSGGISGEPRKTVAEIVAQLQGSNTGMKPLRYTPSDIPWSPSRSPPEHSESSDDEDRPLR